MTYHTTSFVWQVEPYYELTIFSSKAVFKLATVESACTLWSLCLIMKFTYIGLNTRPREISASIPKNGMAFLLILLYLCTTLLQHLTGMCTRSPNCQAKKMTLQMSLEIEILRHIISVTLLAPCSGISALIHNRGQTWHTIWFSLHFEHTKVFAAEKSGFGLYAQCLIVACGRLALSRPAATFTMSSKLGPNREEYRGLATDPGTLFSHLIRSRLLRLIPCNLIRTWLKRTDVVEEFYTKHS